VGAHSSQIERSGEAVAISAWDAGYLIGAGLGGNYYMSKDLLLSRSDNFSYLDNSFYRDGLVHLIQLGMGFQFD
jgi:hypothetical protein